MKPSDNDIEMLAAGFSIQHKNGLIRFAHALLEKYASARAIAFDASTEAAEAQPTWDDLKSLAVKHSVWVPGYGPFAAELLATYGLAPAEQPHWLAAWLNAMNHAAPQASAEAVRNAALEEAAAFLENNRTAWQSFRAAYEIRALKTQADKDGGQQRAGDEKEPL